MMKKLLLVVVFITAIGAVFAQNFKNNFNAVSYDATRLSVERATIYDPGSLDWQFAHAPSITFFKGNFYAVFSNGQSGEDEGKQRIVLTCPL